MRFEHPLVEGRLIRRYKRFLADVRLKNGQVVTASCANTGPMLGLVAPDNRVWLSVDDRAKRKYRHRWELVSLVFGGRQVMVGVNTGRPNGLVIEALEDGRIAALAGYARHRREVAYGDGNRIDLLLEDDRRPPCYVEVKSVTLSRRPGLAEFPDTRTERGTRHLRALAAMAQADARAVMVYVVQRDDAEAFAIAGDLDPAYFQAHRAAQEAGVETLVYRCRFGDNAIGLSDRLRFAC